jgi:hypothetical protein
MLFVVQSVQYNSSSNRVKAKGCGKPENRKKYITSTSLTLPHFCVCPKLEPEFPMKYVVLAKTGLIFCKIPKVFCGAG